MTNWDGRLVDAGDTRLYVVERGEETGYPILALHGGPGLDMREFGDYLDPLTERGYRLLLVDQRAQGRSESCAAETWTIEQMAADVRELAPSLGLERYAVLGHSFGAMVTLQNAVDHDGFAAQSIVSSGVGSARWFEGIEANVEGLEPPDIREQVRASLEAETSVETAAEMEALLVGQLPFHFADPQDPRIQDYVRRIEGGVYTPAVIKHFAAIDYGAIEVEDRLAGVGHPVLVLSGRHDRVCVTEASEFMASNIPGAELVVFEDSGHMTFVEQQAEYLDAVDAFLRRTNAAAGVI
jgi:proline iminopeptidase